MSVRLESPAGENFGEVCNATWAAIIALARAYEPDEVAAWNGCHDGQRWSSEELRIMSARLAQTAMHVKLLADLARAGGVTIS